jgi:hypothetical protein
VDERASVVTYLVKSTHVREREEGLEQRLLRGRVREWEVEDVVYAEGGEEEDDGREGRAVYLGGGVGLEGGEDVLGVEAEAAAGLGPGESRG